MNAIARRIPFPEGPLAVSDPHVGGKDAEQHGTVAVPAGGANWCGEGTAARFVAGEDGVAVGSLAHPAAGPECGHVPGCLRRQTSANDSGGGATNEYASTALAATVGDASLEAGPELSTPRRCACRGECGRHEGPCLLLEGQLALGAHLDTEAWRGFADSDVVTMVPGRYPIASRRGLCARCADPIFGEAGELGAVVSILVELGSE